MKKEIIILLVMLVIATYAFISLAIWNESAKYFFQGGLTLILCIIVWAIYS